MRFVILGKRNRSPSIPPVFWLNLCSQLLLSFENDQIKVFEISELPEVKIRRIPRQIFKNPARAPLSPDQAWNISRAQLSTRSELGERAFQRGVAKSTIFGKKNCSLRVLYFARPLTYCTLSASQQWGFINNTLIFQLFAFFAIFWWNPSNSGEFPLLSQQFFFCKSLKKHDLPLIIASEKLKKTLKIIKNQQKTQRKMLWNSGESNWSLFCILSEIRWINYNWTFYQRMTKKISNEITTIFDILAKSGSGRIVSHTRALSLLKKIRKFLPSVRGNCFGNCELFSLPFKGESRDPSYSHGAPLFSEGIVNRC